MDPYSAIIGGAVGLGTSIFGGIKASQQRKKMNTQLNQQEADNKAWYNANALSDYTQRADSQALLANLRENLASRTKAQSNMAVVTGATPEQQAVAQEQNNETIASVYNNLGAMGQQYKDRITNQYMGRKDLINNQRMGVLQGAANSYENLMNTGLNTVSGMAGGLAGGLGGASASNTQKVTPQMIADYGQTSSQQSLQRMHQLTGGI